MYDSKYRGVAVVGWNESLCFTYNSRKEAADTIAMATGRKSTTVDHMIKRAILRGGNATTYGFHWRYRDKNYGN